MTLEELFAWASSLPDELIITIGRPCQVKLTWRRNIYTMKNYEGWHVCISVPYPDGKEEDGLGNYFGDYVDQAWARPLVWSDGPDLHEVMQHLYDQYKEIEATWRTDHENARLLQAIAEYQVKYAHLDD